MAAEWQHPFVNVFKLCKVDQEAKDVETSGKVALRMDEVIHRKVFKISGAIPAVNYIKLPKAKGLTLYGRFCYIQVKFEPNALFSMHLEVVTADGNTCRISVGNIFKPENVKKKAGCVQYNLKDPTTTWTLLSLDLAAAAVEVAGPAAAATPGSAYSHLKSIQLCSTLTVRGAFTSDIRFGLKTLPRDLVLCHNVSPDQLSQVWLPTTPTDIPEPTAINKPIKAKKPISRLAGKPQTTSARSDVTPSAAAGSNDQSLTASAAAAGELSKELSNFTLSSEPSTVSTSSATTAAVAASAAGPAAAAAVLLPEPYLALQRVNGYTGEYARSMLYCPNTDELIFPAGSIVVALKAGNTAAAAAAAAVVVVPTKAQGSQRFFLGHDAFVNCLALGGGGSLLATGQEGKQAVIRVWDFMPRQQQQQQGDVGAGSSSADSGACLAVLCAHASKLCCLDVSADGRALVAVGADAQSRQVIAVWDVSGIRQQQQQQQAILLVSHVSHHNIRVVKFSPFESDAFMTAGRDSIRTYRIKDKQLRGISVRLEPPVNKTTGHLVGTAAAAVVTGTKIFTDIEYDATSSALQLTGRHVFVASAAGAVFQVDYANRVLVAVYQIHVGAINSIAVGDGLAATASDDKTLRLWPLDFSAYLLEAEHESPVTSTCLTADGLAVAAGCEEGVIGLLDVMSQRYTTLLRSHTGPVTSVVPHHYRPEYCTTSADGSVRVWDITQHQQLYEFGAASDGSVVCAAYHPMQYQLAVGYQQGVIRVFDVATTSLIQEQQLHRGAVQQLLFSPDGNRLFSSGSDGKVVVCDLKQSYAPFKVLMPMSANSAAATAAGQGGSSSSSTAVVSAHPVCAAVSPDGSLLAVSHGAVGLGSSSGAGAMITLFSGAAIEAVMCIETTAAGFERLEFSPANDSTPELWAITSNTSATAADDSSSNGSSGSSIMRFNPQHGTLLQSIPAPHGAAAVTAFAVDAGLRVVATGGADHLMKVWSINSSSSSDGQQQQQQGLPACQSFTGHLGPVTGVAFLGTQLISTGQDGNVMIWSMLAQSTAAAAAAAASDSEAQQQQQAVIHPDANVTMRSWLQRPAAAVTTTTAGSGSAAANGVSAVALAKRLAGAAAAVAMEGVMVPEATESTADEDITPSPLYSQQLQQHGASSSSSSSGARAAVVQALPLTRCSALYGLNSNISNSLLWLRHQGMLAHAAGNVLVLTDLACHQQQLLQHHATGIGALAVSADGMMMATGSSTPEPGSGHVDVAIWDLNCRQLRYVLCQHPHSCHLLSFSPDCCWCVSVGDGLVVVWDVTVGEAAAVGRTHKPVTSIAWLPWRPLPQFITAGQDGLLLWSLQPTYLEQRQLTIPDAAAAAFTAVATAASSGCCPHSSIDGQQLDQQQQQQWCDEASRVVFAADRSGGVWQAAVGEGRLLSCMKMTTLPDGETATHINWSQRSSALAVATNRGRLLRFTSSEIGMTGSIAAAAADDGSSTVAQWWAAASSNTKNIPPMWRTAGSLTVPDGVEITSLQLDPEYLNEGIVATAAATAWYVDVAGQQQVPLMAAHAGQITGLVDAAAAAAAASGGGSSAGGCVASMCDDGWLALWDTSKGSQALPVVEFRSDFAPTSLTFFNNSSTQCIVGYSDGHIACFDLPPTAGARASAAAAAAGSSVGVIRWSVVRHASAVIRVVTHPTQPLVMTASRDGLITVTNTDSSRLVASCRDFTGTTTPMHDLAVNISSGGGGGGTTIAAAAWLDHVIVFAAPWQASTADVLCNYRCPQVPDSVPTTTSSVSFIPGSTNLLLFTSPCLAAAALLLDTSTGHPLQHIILPAHPATSAVAPAGGILAFGLEDGRVVAADVSTDEVSIVGAVGGGGEAVRGLVFTQGGRQLVAAAGKVMAVWNA